jgi:integrase
MPAQRSRPPSYRLHKPSGQALVEIHGKRYYLGRHNSAESRQKYSRLLGEIWSPPAGVTQVPLNDEDPLTVTEIVVAYWEYAQTYYRRADGSPTCEISNIQQAVRPLTELYGDTPAKDFGPLKLQIVRQSMMDGRPATDDRPARRPWCRTSINRQIKRIRQLFKWAASQQKIPGAVAQDLVTVTGLKRGRSKAAERPPVKPVPRSFVEATLPFLRPPVAAMVRLQLLTGARPGEILAMRGRDLDMSGDVWVYKPSQHKTSHRNHEREILLGTQSQEVLRPFLRMEIDAPLFSPRDSVAQLLAERRAEFQKARAESGKKIPPSRDRRIRAKLRRRPVRSPADAYTVHSYRQAIARACDKAGVPSWHPHQLRHSFATEVRRSDGVEVSRILLGHSSLDATAIYAEEDRQKAFDLVRRIG